MGVAERGVIRQAEHVEGERVGLHHRKVGVAREGSRLPGNWAMDRLPAHVVVVGVASSHVVGMV